MEVHKTMGDVMVASNCIWSWSATKHLQSSEFNTLRLFSVLGIVEAALSQEKSCK